MSALISLRNRASLIAILATVPFASSAFAAGFAVKETSPSLQGMAYAGAAAGGDDISAMFNNPATIAYHDGFNTAGGIAVIYPRGEFTDVQASAVTGRPTNDIGVAPGGRNADVVSDELAFVPSTYLSYGINDKLAVGAAITAPFGLVTDYDKNWAGRYHGTRSELLNINFNPVISYKPVPQLAFAVGGVVSYAKADLRNAVDFQTVGFSAAAQLAAGAQAAAANGDAATAAALQARAAQAQAAAGAASDGFAQVEGDEFAFGFTAGVLFQPTDYFRFGVGYRSEIEHDLDGDITFDFNANPFNAAIAAGDPLARLQNQNASAAATLPRQINVGASFDITDQLTLAAEVDWTDWSSFEELRIVGAQGQTISLTEERFQDSFFFSVGAAYKVTDHLTLKLGIAHDQSAVKDEFRTPRLPDADRTWFSAGLGYEVTDHMSLNIGYSYVDLSSVDLNLTATPNPADPDASRGNLSANGDANIHILNIGGVIKF